MEADIVIDGNVGQPVEWRDHEVYGGRASFNVAVTPSYRRGNEWVDQTTMWFRVTCWRTLAAHVRDSLRKGDAVVVKGRLRLDTWKDEHGQPKQGFSIDASWVGHNLQRGRASFERQALRPAPTEPPYVSDEELTRMEDLAAQYAEGTGEVIDADGVVHEAGGVGAEFVSDPVGV